MRRNQCLLFLATVVVIAAAIYAAVTDAFPLPVSSMLYALAAVGFACTLTLWGKAILTFVKVVLLPFTKNNRIANTLITDARLRTVLVTIPGMGLNLIYAVATYTFYKLGMAIRNLIKARKEESLLLVTLRNISYADALVSLLSLQTALLAAFGQDSGELVPLMNALTGASVCLMILGLGSYMVWKSKKIQVSG